MQAQHRGCALVRKRRPIGPFGRPELEILLSYRGTSLIRKRLPLGPYSSHMPRGLGWSYGWGAFSYERGTPVLSYCDRFSRYLKDKTGAHQYRFHSKACPLPSEEGTERLETFSGISRKPRPESGLDCRICAVSTAANPDKNASLDGRRARSDFESLNLSNPIPRSKEAHRVVLSAGG